MDEIVSQYVPHDIENICGYENWRNEFYTAQGHMSRSIVYVVPPDFVRGYADILTGLTTTFLLALLTRRNFHVYWRDGERVWQEKLPNMFIDTLAEDWRTEAYDLVDIPNHARRSYPEYSKLWGDGMLHLDDDESWQFYRYVDFDEVFAEKETTYIMSNRGQIYGAYENPIYRSRLTNMIQDPDHAFGCLLHALFRPKPSIFRHFNRTFLRTILKQKHLIGIHVRVGDSLITHYKKHYNNNELELMRLFANVWKCATEISEERIRRIRSETSTSFLSSFSGYSKNITWLVVSDSVDLRRVLESSLPKYYNVLIPNVTSNIGHTGTGDFSCQYKTCSAPPSMTTSDERLMYLEIAVAEHWFLSMTNRLIISRNSGFSKTAGFLGLLKNRMFASGQKANSKLDESNPCVSENSASMLDMGSDLAHI